MCRAAGTAALALPRNSSSTGRSNGTSTAISAPVIASEGRSHPLTLHHIGRNPARPIEDEVAAAIRLALSEQAEGDILAFLPGVREIDRTAERLAALPHALHLLHGQLEPAQQRAALRPDPEGRRKIILATSIAETSPLL